MTPVVGPGADAGVAPSLGFRTRTELPLSDAPRGLAAADFDGDGRVDIAVHGNALTLFVQDGAGAFQPRVVSEPPTPAEQSNNLDQQLRALDIDRDGRLDLAVNGVDTAVYFNRGDTFLRTPPVDAPCFWGDRLMGDFDGDGALELLCASPNPSLARDLSLVGSELRATKQAVELHYFGRPIAALDLDGDRAEELIESSPGEARIARLLSSGFETLAKFEACETPGRIPTRALAVDVDQRDGLELVIECDRLQVVFREPGLPNVSLPWSGSPLAVADVDGNGRRELVVLDGSVLRLVELTGDGAFVSRGELDLAAEPGHAAVGTVLAADLDGDRRDELVLASHISVGGQNPRVVERRLIVLKF